MAAKKIDLDDVLLDVGEFGKYQKRNLVFICVPFIFAALFSLSYVFAARIPDYRCRIPECENSSSGVEFLPDWLPNAIPFRETLPKRCERYLPISNTTDCSPESFDRHIVETCDQFVFASEKRNIANDFNILCEENHWKLTLVGTINNIGMFISLPLTGFLSDRYGRRTVLVAGITASSVVGLTRSFAPTYPSYILLELIDAIVNGGVYSAGFVLGLELVGPSKRVLIGSIVSAVFPIGEALLGFLAWMIDSWRTQFRIMYPPAMLMFSFLWILPESIRWLILKGRHEEAENILRKVANENKMKFSDEVVKKLAAMESSQSTNSEKGELQLENTKESYPICDIFKCRTLCVRLINCSICWITCTFVYYGLSLNSVGISGNIYLNFIFISLIEIPGTVIAALVLDRYGRRLSQSISFLIAGIACVSFIIIPTGFEFLNLPCFLIGKCAITVAFTAIYVYTAELFPTSVRHSLLATCSMFGRFGSMLAPQTPLLTIIWLSLPVLLFGIMATVAAVITLTFPETLNISLPDTVEEAKNIGKRKSLD